MTKENEDPGSHRHKRSRFRIFVCVCLAFIICGMASNAFSIGSSERAVLRWFTQDIAHSNSVIIGGGTLDDWVLFWRLHEIGATPSERAALKSGAKPFPSCGMGTAIPRFPFVTTVRFNYVTGELGGWGGDVAVLNFFGLSVVLGETNTFSQS